MNECETLIFIIIVNSMFVVKQYSKQHLLNIYLLETVLINIKCKIHVLLIEIKTSGGYHNIMC